MTNFNLVTIFLTGLLTGGLTCLAVQGGLLATLLAQKSKDQRPKTKDQFSILIFLIAKISAYTFLGFLLGWFGSLFEISQTAKIIMQIIAALFMIGTALNLLNVHPLFRYFIIKPPKFLTRIVRKESKSTDFFAPAILGSFTIFIPCGTTQAMMALAIASGNPGVGAVILFTFILGTSPVFFTLGYLATKLEGTLQDKFMKVAAIAIILLSIFNINNAIVLTGSKFTLENLWTKISCSTFLVCDIQKNKVLASQEEKPENEATIKIESGGYNPNSILVKSGSKVTLHIVNDNGYGCIQAFTIPELGIRKIVPPGKSETIEFTAPKNPTEIAFMCSMGMYRGVIKVI